MNSIIFVIGLIAFGGLTVLGVALWIYFEMRKKEAANCHKQNSKNSNRNDNATQA